MLAETARDQTATAISDPLSQSSSTAVDLTSSPPPPSISHARISWPPSLPSPPLRQATSTPASRWSSSTAAPPPSPTSPPPSCGGARPRCRRAPSAASRRRRRSAAGEPPPIPRPAPPRPAPTTQLSPARAAHRPPTALSTVSTHAGTSPSTDTSMQRWHVPKALARPRCTGTFPTHAPDARRAHGFSRGPLLRGGAQAPYCPPHPLTLARPQSADTSPQRWHVPTTLALPGCTPRLAPPPTPIPPRPATAPAPPGRQPPAVSRPDSDRARRSADTDRTGAGPAAV